MVFLAVCKPLSSPDAGIARNLFTPFFAIAPRFVGKTLSGRKAFIALELTAGNKTPLRICYPSFNSLKTGKSRAKSYVNKNVSGNKNTLTRLDGWDLVSFLLYVFLMQGEGGGDFEGAIG